MRWLIAVGIVVAAIVIGSVASGQARRIVSKPTRPERVRSLAQSLSSLVFSLVLAVGLVIALGVADKSTLDRMPDAVVSFVPKALVCALLLILGQTAATMVATAVGGSLLRATGKPQHQAVRVLRAVIFGGFAILAVSQLGVNTRVIDTLVAGLVFGTALSVALLTGLGGREMAGNVAAGRYLRRIVRTGDRVTGDGVPTGVVRALHGATVELQLDGDGATDVVELVHVPNQLLLRTELRIRRAVTGDVSDR